MVWRRIHTSTIPTISLLALALAIPVTEALAQEAVPVKVGVFNADRVLAESAAGKQALALFNQLRDQRAGEVQAQQNEFGALRQQTIEAVPGSAEAVNLQRQVEDMGVQLQRLNEDVQNELGARQASLTRDITQRIAGIIEVLGAEQGFTMIFNSVQSGLIYVDPTADLTDEIIGRLDALGAGGR